MNGTVRLDVIIIMIVLAIFLSILGDIYLSEEERQILHAGIIKDVQYIAGGEFGDTGKTVLYWTDGRVDLIEFYLSPVVLGRHHVLSDKKGFGIKLERR